MLSIETLEDIAALRESVDIECKLALGKDGKGAFPKDAWETYSAFANSSGRATVYFLAKARLEDTYKESVDGETTQALDVSSGGLGVSSGDSAASSGGLDKLRSIAQSVSSKKKAPKTEVEQTILALCAEQPCSLEQLAELLNRSVELVRKSYLQPMIREKRLHYQYPTKPNHPQQRYLISGSDE